MSIDHTAGHCTHASARVLKQYRHRLMHHTCQMTSGHIHGMLMQDSKPGSDKFSRYLKSLMPQQQPSPSRARRPTAAAAASAWAAGASASSAASSVFFKQQQSGAAWQHAGCAGVVGVGVWVGGCMCVGGGGQWGQAGNGMINRGDVRTVLGELSMQICECLSSRTLGFYQEAS